MNRTNNHKKRPNLKPKISYKVLDKKCVIEKREREKKQTNYG